MVAHKTKMAWVPGQIFITTMASIRFMKIILIVVIYRLYKTLLILA